MHVVERRKTKMCKTNCEHPELKLKSGKCSEQQIKNCHGEEKKHPCDCKENEKKYDYLNLDMNMDHYI